MITVTPSVLEELVSSTHIDKPEYPHIKFPSAYLASMKISDYLMLTTYSHGEANEIIKEISYDRYKANPGDAIARWSQEKADSEGIDGIATLAIDASGQIHMHDGRHRAVIAAQSKFRSIPVVIRCTDNGNELQGLHVFDSIKDQFHKGERKSVSFDAVNPIVLVQDNLPVLTELYSQRDNVKDAVLSM
ncbi:hypothetical protein LMH73_023385 [Vibrio splendidus]|nr:hypothetical protein [Vibrio splendidus]MCC4882517.1 hypothetical protein [Vibrio splendidus]